jgi:hypothetical protein
MKRFRPLSILLLFVAIPARGQELIFGANVGGRWDSNVLSSPSPESDFSARVGPEVRLRETQGDLTYDFHYVPTYQAYSRFASLDDWDQLVDGTIDYRLGLNTVISMRNIFDYAPAPSFFLQQIATPAGAPIGTQVVNAVGHYNILVNTASLSLRHSFSELWHGSVTLSDFYYDPRVTNAVTTNTATGSGDLTYKISPVDAIGGSVGATSQQFGSNSVQNSATNHYYNASGIWNHDFSPTWSLNMSVGPTYVKSASVSVPSTTSLSDGPFLSVSGLSQQQNSLFELSPPASLINACSFTSFPGIPSGTVLLNQCNGFPTLPARSIPGLTSGSPPLLTVLHPNAQELAATSVPIQGITQGSNSSLTYFANVLMVKRWETVTGTLGYSRSAGGQNVGISSTEVDTVNGGLVWNITPLWTSSLNVIWSDQSSTVSNTIAIKPIVKPFQYTAQGSFVPNLVPASAQTPEIVGLLFQQGAGTINIYQWVVSLHSDYALTKRLKIFGNFFFLNQTASESGPQQFNLSGLNINSARVDLGFHYEFDPIHL